jgi:hypothetical protein
VRLAAHALRADSLSLSPSLYCLHSEFDMSILKSALVACVMTTSAMLVGYLLPVVINPVSAQAFPPCRNDFRAEIAAGQRSPHYPRCLDAHSPRGPSLQGEPQIENQAFNCPSGQVFSGGSCITIQNQGGGGFACGMVRYQAVAYAVGGIGYGYGQSGVQSAVACNGVSPAYSVITSPENRHYQTIALNCPSGYARMVSSVDWIPDTNADQGQYTRWFITQVCTKT